MMRNFDGSTTEADMDSVREWSTSATVATAYVLPTADADTDTTGMCTGQHELQADARG